MPTVRTVFQPDTDLEVSDEEHRVLLAQGLIHEPAAPAAASSPAAPRPAPVPAKPAPSTATDSES